MAQDMVRTDFERLTYYSLPGNKILPLSNLKAFADNNLGEP